ncbi:MAG: hypothetical protein WC758_03815 [Candidatus Woesearchaeota archaeon]
MISKHQNRIHTKKLIVLLVMILFLPLAMFLLISKKYIELFSVIIAGLVAIDMLSRLFKNKEEEF